jgi:hypothetical protein
MRKQKMEAMETALGYKLQHKNLSQVLDGAPFPPCFDGMIRNIEVILSD